jgi:DNA-binding LacI/PurR family transcriptional regulator
MDVSVVGFDDIVLADLATPPLTTIRQPLPAMADAAFAHLRSGVEPAAANGSTGSSLLMRPELIVRGSTGPPPTS